MGVPWGFHEGSMGGPSSTTGLGGCTSPTGMAVSGSVFSLNMPRIVHFLFNSLVCLEYTEKACLGIGLR